MGWYRQQRKPGPEKNERGMPLAVGITNARGRREAHNCCLGLCVCFRRLATVAPANASPQRAAGPLLRDHVAQLGQTRQGNQERCSAAGQQKSYDSSCARASGTNSDLGAEGLLGILPLRARTAAPHSRHIRAGLRLARLRRARVFTENGPESRPVASRVT